MLQAYCNKWEKGEGIAETVYAGLVRESQNAYVAFCEIGELLENPATNRLASLKARYLRTIDRTIANLNSQRAIGLGLCHSDKTTAV